MNNKLDALGYLLVLITVTFLSWGFYRIFADSQAALAAKIGFSGFWLILSFMFTVYSIGIGKGEEKAKIKIPKYPAIVTFAMAAGLLILAAMLNN